MNLSVLGPGPPPRESIKVQIHERQNRQRPRLVGNLWDDIQNNAIDKACSAFRSRKPTSFLYFALPEVLELQNMTMKSYVCLKMENYKARHKRIREHERHIREKRFDVGSLWYKI